MFARLSLDVAARGMRGRRQTIGREREQTEMIMMRPIAARRLWTPLRRPAEIIDRLPQAFPAAEPARAFGERRAAGGKVVSGPMAPSSSRSVGIVAQKDETAGSRRRAAPMKRRRHVFAVTGERPGDWVAIGKGVALEPHESRPMGLCATAHRPEKLSPTKALARELGSERVG